MDAKTKQRRYIGIKQAKSTIYNIERRIRLGTQRANDQKLLQEARNSLKKWESLK